MGKKRSEIVERIAVLQDELKRLHATLVQDDVNINVAALRSLGLNAVDREDAEGDPGVYIFGHESNMAKLASILVGRGSAVESTLAEIAATGEE